MPWQRWSRGAIMAVPLAPAWCLLDCGPLGSSCSPAGTAVSHHFSLLPSQAICCGRCSRTFSYCALSEAGGEYDTTLRTVTIPPSPVVIHDVPGYGDQRCNRCTQCGVVTSGNTVTDTQYTEDHV